MWHPLNFFLLKGIKKFKISFANNVTKQKTPRKKSIVPNFFFLIYIHCCIGIDIFS